MSRLKKFVAGALAVVLCATSIAAKAPAQAEAACNHTIYKAGTDSKHEPVICLEIVEYPRFETIYRGGFLENRTYLERKCIVRTCTKTIYTDTYKCNKCSYSYTSSYSRINHSH